MTGSRHPEARRQVPRRARDIPLTVWRIARDSALKFFDDSPFEVAAALSFTLMAAILAMVFLYVRRFGTDELV